MTIISVEIIENIMKYSNPMNKTGIVSISQNVF